MKSYIELTNNCNLSCKHCFNNSGKGASNLDSKNLLKLFENIHKLGIEEVVLSGGEPLMHPDIWKFVEKIRTLNLRVRLCTNLLLWDKEKIEYVNSCGNVYINTSLDGAIKDTDDFIRGKGHFDQFIKKINIIQEIKYDKCIVHCTINKCNYNEIRDFINLVKSWGCTPEFSFIENLGRATHNWDNLKISKKEIMKSVVDIKRYSNNQSYIVGQDYRINCCPIHGKYNFFIASNGDVYICNLIFVNKAIIGNIYENTIDEILLSDKYKKIVDMLCSNKSANCDECLSKLKML